MMLSFVLLVRTQQAFQPPTRLLSHMQVMKMLKPYYPSDVLAVLGHEYIKLFMFTLLRVPIFCCCVHLHVLFFMLDQFLQEKNGHSLLRSRLQLLPKSLGPTACILD